MKSLAEAGFMAGVWVEVIVSTYSVNGVPHAAAMGCTTADGVSILLKPFKDTKTYNNLVNRRSLVVNVCRDPVVFYKAVFDQGLTFGEARRVNAPRVMEASAWVEAVVSELREFSGPRAEALCSVENVDLVVEKPRPYSRAEHALMEALIHFTRVRAFAGTERHNEAEALLDRIKYYEKLVQRVSSNEAHLSMIEKIVREASRLVDRA
ncbi:MAG: DUF447 family protein [Candidatus Caldarchaeum sp.]